MAGGADEDRDPLGLKNTVVRAIVEAALGPTRRSHTKVTAPSTEATCWHTPLISSHRPSRTPETL